MNRKFRVPPIYKMHPNMFSDDPRGGSRVDKRNRDFQVKYYKNVPPLYHPNPLNYKFDNKPQRFGNKPLKFDNKPLKFDRHPSETQEYYNSNALASMSRSINSAINREYSSDFNVHSGNLNVHSGNSNVHSGNLNQQKQLPVFNQPRAVAAAPESSNLNSPLADTKEKDAKEKDAKLKEDYPNLSAVDDLVEIDDEGDDPSSKASGKSRKKKGRTFSWPVIPPLLNGVTAHCSLDLDSIVNMKEHGSNATSRNGDSKKSNYSKDSVEQTDGNKICSLQKPITPTVMKPKVFRPKLIYQVKLHYFRYVFKCVFSCKV